MSIDTVTSPDPYEFDKADRMRRALRVSGVSVQEIADALEVGRNSVGAWINGRHNPRPRDLKAFALRTGVSVQWLETGKAPSLPTGPTGGASYTPSDLNREPTD